MTISTSGVVAVVEEDGSTDLRVRLWQSSDWRALPTIAFKSHNHDVTLSSNGEFLGLVDGDDIARVFRTMSGTEVTRFAVRGSVTPMFSPDSTLVAVAGAGHVVRLFDLVRNRERASLAHIEDTPLIAFSRDSQFVASVGVTTRIFSAVTGQEIARIGNPASVQRIEFSSDGMYVATTDGDSTRIWNWRSDDVAGAGCLRLRRQLRDSQWPPAAGEPFNARLLVACPNGQR